MEKTRAGIHVLCSKLSNKIGKVIIKIKGLTEQLRRTKRQRVKLAKWLFEKLLGAFLISMLILYGSLAGLQLHHSSFQIVYSAVTSLSLIAYVLSAFLIPSPKEDKRSKVQMDSEGSMA